MTPPTAVGRSTRQHSTQSSSFEPRQDSLRRTNAQENYHVIARAVPLRSTPSSIHDSYGSEWMSSIDFDKLIEDVHEEIRNGASSVAILGLTPITLRLLATLHSSGTDSALHAIYAPSSPPYAHVCTVAVHELSRLQDVEHDVIVVAADAHKEDLIRAAVPYIRNTPRIVLAGYAHLRFRDHLFDEILSGLLVPSLANGYPHTLTHLYECLRNAAQRRCSGVVAEFGMFKGGTTMFLSRVVEELGMDWPVIGFDTFAGFPPRRNVLDMYDHPDCGSVDLPSVRRYLHDRNVEIVVGDIVETCHRLATEDLVLTFMDTDNYTPASAALNIVRERTIVGGAIVFDHFTGVDRFRYTLGERFAASTLVDDERYFNLHATGVFYRQA